MYIHFANKLIKLLVLLKNNFESKGNLNVKIEDTIN